MAKQKNHPPWRAHRPQHMKIRLVNVSPWIFAAACSLLAVIIGVFAINNYRREKMLMMEVLVQKGTTIIGFVNSGSMAKFRGESPNFNPENRQWTGYVQQIIEQAAEQPGVHFVLLADQQGNILAGSENDRIGAKISPKTGLFLEDLINAAPGQPIFRFNFEDTEDTHGFQIAAVYTPLSGRETWEKRPMGLGMGMGRGMGGGRGRQMQAMEHRLGHGFRQWREAVERLQAGRYILLVELDPKPFNIAVKRQLLQIVILSVVLLLVGIGGWLSLLTLQGYKISQTRLRRIRVFTDLLVSSLPIGLVATDHHGNIRIFNRVAGHILGIGEEQTVGRPPAAVLPGQLGEIIEQTKARDDDPLRQEITLEIDGKSRSLLLATLAIGDSEDRHAGTMMLVQDVSDMKKLQDDLQRSERLAALGAMAAGVAHELRNPLSSIKGLAILLKSRFTDAGPDSETADILVREVERLNRSIGELLDYAQPDKLDRRKTSLTEILAKSISLIRLDADSAGIAIKTEYSAAADFVDADQDKLNQVFLNLFLNAIQAMPEGGTLAVSTSLEEEKVTCRIKDTGCGIDAALLPRVFDLYVTTKSDGAGLGLAMCAKIIAEHRGTIEIHSAIGQGATVIISLPHWHE